MQSSKNSTNQIRSIPNDRDFAPPGNSSFLVLSTHNRSRLNRVLPATAQKALAENTLSNRTIGGAGKGYVLYKQEPLTVLNRIVSEDCDDEVNARVFFNCATLFDVVMDFMD